MSPVKRGSCALAVSELHIVDHSTAGVSTAHCMPVGLCIGWCRMKICSADCAYANHWLAPL